MADGHAEMKVKDDEGTTGNESDTFEDAHDSASRPLSTASVPEGAQAEPNGHADGPTEPSGLAIDGAGDAPQSTVETPAAVEGQDESAPAASEAALDQVPELPEPDSATAERTTSPAPLASGAQSPTKHMHGLSGDFAVNTPPPPSTAERAHALEQRHVGDRPPLAKKSSGGFAGFLGRMGSIRKGRSPSAPRPEGRFARERRDTGASAAQSSGETSGRATPTTARESGHRHKLSLQDQFQSLRRQEEHVVGGANGHLPGADEETTPAAGSPSEHDAASPPLTGDDAQHRLDRVTSTGAVKSPPLNPSLPPGTASGLTAGPSEVSRPINWDLWQAVVYEGPAAVQRSSGAELREAIASGIPPAVRGVVWQVLAESKSEELESLYRSLKARGTDDEHLHKPVASLRRESHHAVNGRAESVASSRSSVHSESSTPATSAMTSPPPSVEGNGAETQAKLLAEKQKRESAALAKLEKAIRRDLGARTSYSKYTQSTGLQDGLFGVCKAYALFDEGVGYAQGMNFIAMPLLFNMSEEEAFTLLVRLMSKYDVRSMFTVDMAGLHRRLYQFERLLEDIDPALYCHLRRRHVGPQLYATQWFLTLFAYRFPLQLVLRVYDLIFSEGLTAILKFGIVLMQRNREALLEMKDMSHLSTFLKEKLFDVYIDKSPSASSLLDSGFFGSVTGGADKELYRADELVRDACQIVVSDEMLARYTAEWEESQRTERERAEELETLRSTNSSLTAHVKTLEERTQQHDAEHVTIAGDLVKLKVENESLLDENEGLKMRVEELQKLVDTLPAEVETRLKAEMDRIMQRNIEVQNENRALKEEAEEMEQELVNAKMMHAQARSDHESLQQKLASVQTLLGST